VGSTGPSYGTGPAGVPAGSGYHPRPERRRGRAARAQAERAGIRCEAGARDPSGHHPRAAGRTGPDPSRTRRHPSAWGQRAAALRGGKPGGTAG
jgi:hypothetical protein